MLKFYQHHSNEFTHWVAQKLDQMVVAHRLVSVDELSRLPEGISRDELPVLSDGREMWKSEEDIRTFLEELHQDLIFSRGVQSDACHLDPDNPGQCL